MSRTAEFAPTDDANPVDLAALFELDNEAFRRRFRATPLWRARRRGILRNAAIVLGNQRAAGAFAALVRGLEDDEPLVRAACAWALGQIGQEAACQALQRRLDREPAEDVRREILAALEAG